MKIDILIEYDKDLSEVIFSSKATNFIETRPARIGLSRAINDNSEFEMVEFVGEDWELVKNVHKLFEEDKTRKDWILRVVNPFESANFEPVPLFRMIDYFSRYILAMFYPKTWNWRRTIPLMNKYEITLKIPGYNFFNPQKKSEFEKLLNTKYKTVTFVS